MLSLRSTLLLAAVVAVGLTDVAAAQRRGVPRNSRAQTVQNRQGAPQARTAQNRTQQARAGAPRPRSNGNQQLPKADLALQNLKRQGNVVSLTVRNLGAVQASQTKVRLELRSFANGQTVATKTARVGTLAPGGSTNINFHSLPLDNVKVIVNVDADNAIVEPNENNNRGVLSIGNVRQRGADLTISQIGFDAPSKTVIVLVRNNGPGDMTAKSSVQLQSYFGPGNRVERKSMRFGPLKSGSSTNVKIKVQQLRNGMQFEAQVDTQNDVPEPNERNNRKMVTFG